MPLLLGMYKEEDIVMVGRVAYYIRIGGMMVIGDNNILVNDVLYLDCTGWTVHQLKFIPTMTKTKCINVVTKPSPICFLLLHPPISTLFNDRFCWFRHTTCC